MANPVFGVARQHAATRAALQRPQLRDCRLAHARDSRAGASGPCEANRTRRTFRDISSIRKQP
jgi:hypothetical protein